MAKIQGVYVALFGRPADPDGLAFWEEQTGGGADLSAMIGTLTGTEEYALRFDGMSNEAIINGIYLSLFGRDAEPDGLAFFLGELEAGRQTIETIAINILDGAQGADLATLDAKLDAADLFTARLDLDAEVEAYVGMDAAEVGVNFLAGVDADNPAGEGLTDENILLLFEDPQGGGSPSGGGGGNNNPPPDQPLKVVVFDNSDYVDSGEDGVGEESTNVQASLAARGFEVSTVVDLSAASFEAALAGKDVLLLPEQETSSVAGVLANDLSDEAKQVIEDFVNNGGRLIIHGDEPTDQSGVGVVNDIFGLNLTEEFDVGASTKTDDASGSFSDDPATLLGNTAMSGIDIGSLPEASIVMYETDIGEFATVATIKQGQGEIVYLGWDWEDADPIGSQDGGWLEVLDSAVRYDFNRAPVTGPITVGILENEFFNSYSVDLLWTATDADGDTLAVENVEAVFEDSEFGYEITPDFRLAIRTEDVDHLAEGEEATAIVTYDIVDGQGGSAQGMVTINVTGYNDAPVVTMGQSFSSNGAAGAVGTILATDVDSEILTFDLVMGPAPFAVGADGTITLMEPVEEGTYQLIVRASDGIDESSSRTVEVVVETVGPADLTVDGSQATDESIGRYQTIQEAVDAADARNAPTTIQINAGTYVEQVVIDDIDDLELRGVGRDQVIIRAPEDVVKTATAIYEAGASSDDVFAVVQAVDAMNVTISGVTVDGDNNGAAANGGQGTDAPYFTGIGYVRASGTVDDVGVIRISDEDPASEAWQSGVLVFNAYEDTGLAEGYLEGLRPFALTNSTIEDTGFYGVAAYGADVTIENNVIVAGDVDGNFGFFGMELFEVTGRVEGNTILNLSGVDYGISEGQNRDLVLESNQIFAVGRETPELDDDMLAEDGPLYGIYSFASVGTTIDANKIDGVQYSISALGAEGVIVVDNVAENFTEVAFLYEESSSIAQFRGNAASTGYSAYEFYDSTFLSGAEFINNAASAVDFGVWMRDIPTTDGQPLVVVGTSSYDDVRDITADLSFTGGGLGDVALLSGSYSATFIYNDASDSQNDDTDDGVLIDEIFFRPLWDMIDLSGLAGVTSEDLRYETIDGTNQSRLYINTVGEAPPSGADLSGYEMQIRLIGSSPLDLENNIIYA
ncbi:VCBS domain-containing protein [Mesorhizobium sp. CAU 1741]|uniref:Ig-like domain-containing protein n=1 Tax=Mesorhizobium sp. CAU 1741 TaxID=3140366 RepID=UPI00325AD0CC